MRQRKTFGGKEKSELKSEYISRPHGASCHVRSLSFSLLIPASRKFVHRGAYSGTATPDGVGVPSQAPSPPAAEPEFLQTVSLCNGAIVRASHFACAAVIPSQPPAAPGARRRYSLRPNNTNPTRQQWGICTAPSTPVGAEGTRPNAGGGTKPRRRSNLRTLIKTPSDISGELTRALRSAAAAEVPSQVRAAHNARRRSNPVNLHINSHPSTEILSKNELIYPTVKIA